MRSPISPSITLGRVQQFNHAVLGAESARMTPGVEMTETRCAVVMDGLIGHSWVTAIPGISDELAVGGAVATRVVTPGGTEAV